MTTISPRRRGRRQQALRLFLYAVLILIVGAILFVWRAPLTGLFWSMAAPVFSLREALVSQSEVDDLRSKLAQTEFKLLDRDALFRENIDLKARLGRTISSSTLLAAIIMRPPQTPYDTLMLGVGSSDGVAVGDPVFASGSAIIGMVSEVYSSVSRVTLFSSPGEVHEALVFSAGGSIPISLEGQGAGSFIGRLPQGTPLHVGDTILFPNIMPLFVAEVSYVETLPGESFQTVYMQLPVNPLMLRFVEVRHAEP